MFTVFNRPAHIAQAESAITLVARKLDLVATLQSRHSKTPTNWFNSCVLYLEQCRFGKLERLRQEQAESRWRMIVLKTLLISSTSRT